MKLNLLLLCVAAVLGLAVAAEEIVCPTEQRDDSFVVQFPSRVSCSVFYKCNRGVATAVKCPDGLHYNQYNQACDFPARARCQLKDII